MVRGSYERHMTMRTLQTALLLISLTTVAFGDKPAPAPAPAPAATPAKAPAAPPPAPAMPPELKKTVDAFTGTWTIDATVTMPGAPNPIKLKETIVCKKTVAGRVASCTGTANVPALGGKMEDLMLVTYDTEAKKVRVMGLSSMGEVHDHTCAWKDDKTLACDPLSVTAMGGAATVAFEMTFDGKSAKLSETTTLKDGSKMAMVGTATKK